MSSSCKKRYNKYRDLYLYLYFHVQVRCCTVLDPSIWMSGVMNEVFVSGLPGLVGLPVHSHWSVSLQYALVCRSCAYDRCFLFPEGFSDKCPVIPFCSLSLQIPSLSSVNRVFVFLNWYKFVVSALSSLLNGMLHYQYIVTALKLLFTIISPAFAYKHRKCIQKLCAI